MLRRSLAAKARSSPGSQHVQGRLRGGERRIARIPIPGNGLGQELRPGRSLKRSDATRDGCDRALDGTRARVGLTLTRSRRSLVVNDQNRDSAVVEHVVAHAPQ